MVPVYVLSDWQGAHDWTGPIRQQFLCGCLESLARNLESLGSLAPDATATARVSVETYIKELAWQEFYLAILWHYPEVFEKEFHPEFRGMPWPGTDEHCRRLRLRRWEMGDGRSWGEPDSRGGGFFDQRSTIRYHCLKAAAGLPQSKALRWGMV